MRAAKLNRRLLSLGRQDSDVHHGPVDVNVVIEGMRRLLTRIAGASLELVVRLDNEPCIVRADTAQLEQVILNLVTNARDAMPNNGRLTIETAHSARPSPESPDAESVVVRVSDTGVGMDEGTRRHIFEPFFTTKGTSGTGLGLAAVRDIVTTYGGAVSVESRPGAGTRFEADPRGFLSACGRKGSWEAAPRSLNGGVGAVPACSREHNGRVRWHDGWPRERHGRVGSRVKSPCTLDRHARSHDRRGSPLDGHAR
jgi:two-component sensor histidine kinase